MQAQFLTVYWAHQMFIWMIAVQVMVKLRNARNLDARQNLLIDGAAHACKPAAALTPRRKQYAPLEAYMRHLILVELFTGDVKKVCSPQDLESRVSGDPGFGLSLSATCL